MLQLRPPRAILCIAAATWTVLAFAINAAFASAPPEFFEGPQLAHPAAAPASAVLADGTFFVTGGYDTDGYERPDTYLYDMTSLQLVLAVPAPHAVALAVAVTLHDGRVAVIGGVESRGSRTVRYVQIFDPMSGTWTTGAQMTTARIYHTATVLTDGRVLVVGGATAAGITIGSVELYNPATNTWTAGPDIPQTRDWHTATMLPDGRVLVAGGNAFYNYVTQTALIYNPSTNTWQPAASMPSGPIRNASALLLPNGRVLFAGGSPQSDVPSLRYAWLYDPASNTWARTGDMTERRRLFGMALQPNGTVIALGGYVVGRDPDSGIQPYPNTLTSSETYDPATGRWTAGPAMLHPRFNFAFAVSATGTVAVAGGAFEHQDGQSYTGYSLDSTEQLGQRDTTPPVVTGQPDRPANASGWYNAPVIVTWSATDPQSSSGAPTTPPPTTLATEGANQTVTSQQSCDPAGNCSTGTYSLSIDAGKPAISAAQSPPANSRGWNNTPVTVSFDCADTLSGIASCAEPITLNTDGPDQTVGGTARDRADNVSATTAMINIDTQAPDITYQISPQSNGDGWNNTTVSVTFECIDDLSGIAACPQPMTVDADTSGQLITATATDNASNSSTTNLTVRRDTVAPTIVATSSPTTTGWNNSDAVVWFTCNDDLSGVASCPNPAILTSEGADQTITGEATDHAGNTSTTTVSVNIDKTAPTLGTPTWTANPKPIGTPSSPVTSTMTVSATDNLSGITRGEYFIGTDPGIGQGTPTPFAAGSLSATIGADLPVGVYDIGIRALDNAANWSPTTTTMLVVYDPAVTLGITGKNKNDLVPSLANGDVLPGLVSADQTDSADYGFTVDYRNGILHPHNDFHFTYTTGVHCQTPHPVNCHTFTLDATSFAWLLIDQTNNSRGRFQGLATITIDGTASTNPFTMQAIDGNRLNPATPDQATLKIFNSGADPATGTPIYQVTGALPTSNSVKIQ